jgi:hypothetical protein
MKRIAIHKDDYHFRIRVGSVGNKEFSGMVIESDIPEYKIGVVKKRWLKEYFDIYEIEKVKEMDAMNKKEDKFTTIETPKHYDNGNGTLYKVADERGWNPYLFDIVKRLERADKKGEFETDLKKSIAVIQLWLEESKKENHGI